MNCKSVLFINSGKCGMHTSVMVGGVVATDYHISHAISEIPLHTHHVKL